MPLEVIASASRRAKGTVRVHRARTLIAEDRALIDRIPVTAVPRTLLDCAASEPGWLLDRYLERSEELELFDLTAVERVLERTVGHPGHGRLRRALALYREPVFSRSRLERRFLALVARVGLPRPATGFNVVGHELDVYWPQERFGVELDTFGTHGTRGAFERDRRRDEDLALAGVETIRVTDRRLAREPSEVIDRVARLLARRGAAGA